MAKSKGLMASLEDDIKAAGITEAELAAFDGNDNTPNEGDYDGQGNSNEDDDFQPDGKAARDRVAKRRTGRKPLDDEDESSSDASGGSRGSDGDSSGPGAGASQDGEGVQGEDEELEPTTEAGWAKQRRLLRESNARATQLEKDLLAAKAAPAPAAATETASTAANPSTAVKEATKQRTIDELGAEPNRDEDLAGWLVYNAERTNIMNEEIRSEQKRVQTQNSIRQAFVEIEGIENDYKAERPDYDKAIAHASKEYSKAVKILMPHYTDAQIKQAIDKEKFTLALKCNAEGTNLGEVLYDIAVERFGYDPATQEDDSGDGKQPPKPASFAAPKASVKTVANNQRKSGSQLEGGGTRGAPRITIEQASQMTPFELMSLSPEDHAYLDSLGF